MPNIFAVFVSLKKVTLLSAIGENKLTDFTLILYLIVEFIAIIVRLTSHKYYTKKCWLYIFIYLYNSLCVFIMRRARIDRLCCI
jgi:hypothetical protein